MGRQARADHGERPDPLVASEREEPQPLRKKNAELRRENAILKDASVYSAAELDPTPGAQVSGGVPGIPLSMGSYA